METFPYHIRPIDISKDAAEIAVLIRTGFRPWLDHGNLEYLNNSLIYIFKIIAII